MGDSAHVDINPRRSLFVCRSANWSGDIRDRGAKLERVIGLLVALYVVVALWLSLYGFQALALTALYFRHRRASSPAAAIAEEVFRGDAEPGRHPFEPRGILVSAYVERAG